MTTSSTSTLPSVSTSDCPPPHPGSHEGRPSTTWTPPVQKPDGQQVRNQLIKLLIKVISYIILYYVPICIFISRKKNLFSYFGFTEKSHTLLHAHIGIFTQKKKPVVVPKWLL